jgi:hypothetical protein
MILPSLASTILSSESAKVDFPGIKLSWIDITFE